MSSGIQLSGLATGIDTASLVNQLVAAEHQRYDLYQKRQSTWNDRKTALNDVESKLKALNSAAGGLDDAEELRAYTASSSDTDIVTAEASGNAFEGNHSVTVHQLANADRWVHTAGKTYSEDYVGAGTFIYSCNHQETTITTTDKTSLDDLVGLINNDANNPGVTASLLYYNKSYHLVLNGNNAGSDYEIQINSSNTELWQMDSPLTISGEDATRTDTIANLDQFGGTFVGDETITVSGKLHNGTDVNQSFAVNRYTTLDHVLEEINGAFGDTATATLVNGQIQLTDHTSGTSQMRLTLAYNHGSGTSSLNLPAIHRLTQGGSIAASLAGFATANFTETQAAQDSQIKVDGYPPGQTEWITRSSNTIDDVIQGVTLHLHDAGAVQVNLTRDVGLVKGKIEALVAAYNAAVSTIQDKTGYNATTKTAGVLMGDSLVSSIASEICTPFLQRTSGFVADVDTFLMPAQIGLSFDRDGKLSLDSNTFSQAIVKDYLGTLAIIGAAKTGSSDSNTIGFYSAADKYTTAGTYDVEVTVTDGAITGAKMKLPSESAYRTATIQGNIVTGDSRFDSRNEPINPENGLQLSVDLSHDGTFDAAVEVKQGFAGALANVMDRMLKDNTGTIQLDIDAADDQIKSLQDRMDQEQTRLDNMKTSLTAKYARMESTLTLLQNQMSALSYYGISSK
jgi:flagellar capping protein FliD